MKDVSNMRNSSIRRYKNGRTTFIKLVLVNTHKTTAKQIKEFYSYKESEILWFENKFVANNTNYNKQFVS